MDKNNRPYYEIINQKHKNWTEDYQHENGNYLCTCNQCDHEFIGHKRRVICRECFYSPLKTNLPPI